MHRLIALLLLLVGVGVEEQALAGQIQRFDITGELGGSPIVANRPWDFAAIEGWFELDLDASFFNSGSVRQYNMIDWEVNVTPTGNASTIVLRHSGEPLDGGLLALNRFSDNVGLSIDEDIDKPGTPAFFEDRTLSLSFASGIDIGLGTTITDIFDQNPSFGDPSTYFSGAFQFSTSQFPTLVTTATLSRTSANVPAPLSAPVLLVGLMVVAWGGSRRTQFFGRRAY